MPSLTVSLVLHHSPLPQLAATVRSLALAVADARRAGVLGGAALWVVDNSVDAPYAAAARDAVASLLDETGALSYRFLVLEENRGFGAGHNRVLLDSESDYHLVLNPDVELARDALSAGLALLARDPGIAALNPYAEAADGRREYLCKRHPTPDVLLLRGFAPAWLRRRAQRRLARYEVRELCASPAVAEVPLLSGCFLLLRGRPARLCRGFDTGYFMYFEDFDLSRRLRPFGRLVYAPQVRIVHHGGYAANKGWRHVRWFLRSALRFFRQHGFR
ncbi:Glycosyltransferase [Pseudohaliea rubra DSM 19751]|uniref:Glycosyltransferase n=1 Tax=Pseudohaliea rubra DSM 19751 TaxID=1265313 RepID=A0A095VMV0_9GAMM|nr:Glycosyltransferase [Pseudohaliea rubra DSM 19751]